MRLHRIATELQLQPTAVAPEGMQSGNGDTLIIEGFKAMFPDQADEDVLANWDAYEKANGWPELMMDAFTAVKKQ